MQEVLELEIPTRPEFVALVRLVVSSVASTRRVLAEDRIDDIKLAVSEACTNAIEAHGATATEERVLLRCWSDDRGLRVTIEDRGPGFDPESLPEHPPITDPERLNFERGLGITLIKALVDDVQFSSTSSGTEVRIAVHHTLEDEG